MRRCTATAAAVIALAALVAAAAADELPATATAEETAGPTLALGASLGWQQRDDFGAGGRSAFAPELLGYGYLERFGRLHLRPGLRLGFVGLGQAEMPRSVRIEEYDLTARAELGALYDGPVIPSVTLGVGAVTRWVRLETEEPLMVEPGADDISRTELFPELYGRIGLGLPIARGRLVVEPFLGRSVVFGDRRMTWSFGADATFAL